MLIKKRDEKLQDYNLEKISIAISGAFNDFNEEFDDVEVLNLIDNKVHSLSSPVDIEDIQDIVEDVLLDCGYRKEAKSYAKYRMVHEIKRYQSIDEEIEKKLLAKNIENQNANVDEKSFGGRMGEANDIMTKNYALNHCMSKMARENHLNNEIYIHDLSHYAVGDHNCLSIPFDDLLANGFNTRQTDVRPANSVNTAFQLVAVIFQLQSLQQFGGTSATHIDWTMVPYVRKSFYKHFLDGVKYLEDNKDIDNRINNTLSIEDELYKQYEKAYQYAMDMTEKETHQAVEGMFHNLNTLQSRSGNQLPFTSVNYGTCTLPEGRMVTKALLTVSIEGLGNLHKTSIFPCGIFQCMKGVNRESGDKNYDLFQLATQSTAKRLYPNYANVDWTGNAGYDVNDPRTYFSTMGKCKLQLI
jgi:ribonucleoside-triphosphate reductase